MYRWDIINSFINKYDYKSYLEIGVQLKNNFNKINCNYKVSVDPDINVEADFNLTSDDYFEQLAPETKFDIIFIDGLHLHEQLTKDIHNALKHLSENGTIVCHDILPNTYQMQLRYPVAGPWTGDVWRSIAELRMSVDDLEIHTIDTDYGCAVIRRGKNFIYNIPNGSTSLSFDDFLSYKDQMLNVITPQQFIQHYEL